MWEILLCHRESQSFFSLIHLIACYGANRTGRDVGYCLDYSLYFVTIILIYYVCINCALCTKYLRTESNPGQATGTCVPRVTSSILYSSTLLLLYFYILVAYTLSKMQALKLSKKYPEFKQDEIFDLVNKFR